MVDSAVGGRRWQGLILKRDFEGGQMARDMTVYVDDDGKAYHIFASEENLTLHIAELSDDYLSHTGKYVRVAPAGQNEAPAIFKKDGMYWMITSGCTGWAPNEARMFSAPSIWGPWTQHPNPCVGPNREITFGGQSTYILKVEDERIALSLWETFGVPNIRVMPDIFGCLFSLRMVYRWWNGRTVGHWIERVFYLTESGSLS